MHWTQCEHVTLLKPFVPPFTPIWTNHPRGILEQMWVSYLSQYWPMGENDELEDYEARSITYSPSSDTLNWHQDCMGDGDYENKPAEDCAYIVAWANTSPTKLRTLAGERITGIRPFNVILFANDYIEHATPHPNGHGRWFCRARIPEGNETARRLLGWLGD